MRRSRPLDPDEPGAQLWVREHLFAEPDRIPRERWTFARRGADSPAPGPDRVALAGGFETGRIYDLVYTPAECPVVGAGLLAVRDLAAFARFGEGSPAAGRVDHVIAEGVSQCGRFLRTLLHAGLNRDEAGADGIRRGAGPCRRRAPRRIQPSLRAAFGAADPEPRPPLPVRGRAADRSPVGTPGGSARPAAGDRLRAEDLLHRHVVGVLARRCRARSSRPQHRRRRGAAPRSPPLSLRRDAARPRCAAPRGREHVRQPGR